MLSTWNAENINHLGPSQRGGSKSFKALGDGRQGSSENPPPPSGKGMLQQQQQQQRKLKPLGSYSENAPPSAAKSKGKVGGLGLLPTTSSKPQQKQRRALGDISNAGKLSAGGSGNAPAKLSGKQPTPGLSFAVHSDAGKAGGAGVAKARGSGSRVAAAAAVKGRSAARPEEHVDDVELVLGRTGDEEEVLVERRAEQRAAASALKYATRSRSSRPRSRSRSQSTSAAFAKPSASAFNSGSTSKTRFGRDITNTAAAPACAAGAATAGACGVGACGAGALDKSLDSAIDRICLNDFEDGKMALASGGKEESARALLEGDGDMDMHMDMDMDMDMGSLAMALESQNLDSIPDGLVDDEGFLTQEMELSLSFV